jgi:hypothetical protein
LRPAVSSFEAIPEITLHVAVHAVVAARIDSVAFEEVFLSAATGKPLTERPHVRFQDGRKTGAIQAMTTD